MILFRFHIIPASCEQCLSLKSLLLLDHVSFFLIHREFQSSDRVELDFCDFVIKNRFEFQIPRD